MKPILLSALLLATALEAAPRLVVVLKTGAQAETDVSAISKVTFSATDITVHDKDGKTVSTPLGQIQRIQFATGSSVRGFSLPGGAPGLLAPDGDAAALLRLDAPARVEAALLRLDGSRAVDLGLMHLPAGTHRVSWAGTGTERPLESGLYLLQVRLEGRAPERALIRWMP